MRLFSILRLLPLAVSLGMSSYQTRCAIQEQAEDLSIAGLCAPQTVHCPSILAPDDDDPIVQPDDAGRLLFSTESGLRLPAERRTPGGSSAVHALPAGYQSRTLRGLSPPHWSVDFVVSSPSLKRLLCDSRRASAPPSF